MRRPLDMMFNVMYPANPARKTGPCGIFRTLISPGSGLRHRFAWDDLIKRRGIKIP